MITNITFDKAEADAFIDALPSHIFKAVKSSVFHTTGFAQQEMERRLEAKTAIPSYVFRRIRVRIRRSATINAVWVGANMVKASYVGDLSEDSYGAYAGSYIFKGSFIANMKSGHTGIFKRKGKSRLPLAEQGVQLKLPVIEVAQEVAGVAGDELRRRFAAKVRELNPYIE